MEGTGSSWWSMSWTSNTNDKAETQAQEQLENVEKDLADTQEKADTIEQRTTEQMEKLRQDLESGLKNN